MKKSIFLFIYILCSGYATTQIPYIVNKPIEIRMGPGSKYEMVRPVPEGDTLLVLDKSNVEWYQVLYRGEEGYAEGHILDSVMVQLSDMPQESSSEVQEASDISITPFIIFGLMLAAWLMYNMLYKKKYVKELSSMSDSPEDLKELYDQQLRKLKKQLKSELRIELSNEIKTELIKEINASVRKDMIDLVVNAVKEEYKNQQIEDFIQKAVEEQVNIQMPAKTEKGLALLKAPTLNEPVEVSAEPGTSETDDGIIDITGIEGEILIKEDIDKQSIRKAPYWEKNYVYTFSFLENANQEQKEYYHYFKGKFQEGIYPILGDNLNYAFVLLFDLLRSYDEQKDIKELRKNLLALGSNYPRTRKYCKLHLEQIESKIFKNDWPGSNSAPEYKLGDKYQEKLNFKEHEVSILNRIWVPSNNFCAIDQCIDEIVKLFIRLVNILDRELLESKGQSFQDDMRQLAITIAEKENNIKLSQFNFSFHTDPILDQLYLNIFKRAENRVREIYGHKRLVNAEINFTNKSVEEKYQEYLVVPTEEILALERGKVTAPSEDTEVQLNLLNTTRWKEELDFIKVDFENEPKAFFDATVQLGIRNRKNPAVEHIFYEASKFISDQDRHISLVLYFYYLDYDMRSTTFDNKKLTATLQKKLFESQEELRLFQEIVSEFIIHKDLAKAIAAVPGIFKPERKKIVFDPSAIQSVYEQHSGTVDLLNEYLKDDYEDDHHVFTAKNINQEEITFDILSKEEFEPEKPSLFSVELSEIQKETIAFFLINNFSISIEELDDFVREKGGFRNSLVESINDAFYEELEDILIEEEDDFYIMNGAYYETLFKP